MRRREFALLGATAVALPVMARAQQTGGPVIGVLHAGLPEAGASNLIGFRRGLSEAGFVEGRNLTIEYRWADNNRERLPELAADLVRRGVSVIATPGTLSATLAAKTATSTIPIVFSSAGDPVGAGLVASLNRPGGNVTGATNMIQELGAKRFGILHELRPGTEPFAMLLHPTNPNVEFLTRENAAASQSIGRQIDIAWVSTPKDID
jgi:ABC-type uncharacterized transport system substrate-binding protein